MAQIYSMFSSEVLQWHCVVLELPWCQCNQMERCGGMITVKTGDVLKHRAEVDIIRKSVFLVWEKPLKF